MKITKKLTEEQILIMKSVRNGADIFDHKTAGECLKLAELGLIHTCKPMGDYAVTEPRPCIGAILTSKGRNALKNK